MLNKVGRRHAILALWCLMVVLRPAWGGAPDPVFHTTVGGMERSYAVHAPDRKPPAAGFPLVLAFHGGGSNGAGMMRMTGLNAVADTRGAIVVYPDGVDRHWNDGRSTIKNKTDDVAFVNAILDEVGRRYAVDRGRIFATGASNGALFVQRLGCELSSRVAAIAPLAGPMPADLASHCRPAQPVSVLQIEGDSDPIMPFAGGKVADFGGIGEGGVVISTSDTMAQWSRIDGCLRSLAPENLPLLGPADGTEVIRTTFEQCRGGTSVELVVVHGGGHTWPGSTRRVPQFLVGKTSVQLNASAAIMDFFLALPPKQNASPS
jgi:polyhydroxybutyrate depolymerase